MMPVMLLKVGIIAAGGVTIAVSFWLYTTKRMVANLALVWDLLGVALVLLGAVPAFSAWLHLISLGTGAALFCLGIALVWGGFQVSLLLSRLIMKNQEMALQISLILEENERMSAELDEALGRHEKNAAGDEHPGARRCGDGPDGIAEKTGWRSL